MTTCDVTYQMMSKAVAFLRVVAAWISEIGSFFETLEINFESDPVHSGFNRFGLGQIQFNLMSF